MSIRQKKSGQYIESGFAGGMNSHIAADHSLARQAIMKIPYFAAGVSHIYHFRRDFSASM